MDEIKVDFGNVPFSDFAQFVNDCSEGKSPRPEFFERAVVGGTKNLTAKDYPRVLAAVMGEYAKMADDIGTNLGGLLNHMLDEDEP